jgi:hypothetical protein
MANGEKHRQFGDPTHIGSRGKTASQRKGRYDGGWTATEQRTREKLMKQFTKLEGESGNSDAYVNASCWCWCGRLRGGCSHSEESMALKSVMFSDYGGNE